MTTYRQARSGLLVPASLATWRCAKGAPAVITPSKVLTADGVPWSRNRKARGGIVRPRDGRLRVFSARHSNAQAGGGIGGGGGGSVTGFSAVSRNIASNGGGCSIVATCTGVSGTPTVLVNGVSATVTGTTSTSVTFTVPSSATVGLVNVQVGSFTLSNGLEYGAAPSGPALNAWHDLSSGMSNYILDGPPTVSTAFALPNTTHSIKFTVTNPAGDIVRLFSTQFSVADNVHPNGVWGRFWMLQTAASYANAGTNLKFHLCRSNAGSGAPAAGYIISNGGGGFPPNTVGWQDDATTGDIGEASLGNYYDGTWREFLVQYIWLTGISQGRIRLWVNGLSIPAATLTNAAIGSAATDYQMDFGIPFLNSCTGTVDVYFADLWNGDGCPDPQTVS